MEKELIEFILEKELSPFNKYKTPVKSPGKSIFKTSDAKAVYSKVINILSSDFLFQDSSSLWACFSFSDSYEEIRRRQDFFSSIKGRAYGNVLRLLKTPKQTWRPSYGVVVVTEDDKTYTELKELGCPIKFLISDYDVQELERYDVVQVVNCENYSRALEQLPQAVFLDSADDAYLERYAEILSGWKDNLEELNRSNIDGTAREIVNRLYPLLSLLSGEKQKILSREEVEDRVSRMNESLMSKIKQMTLSGDVFLGLLNKSSVPQNISLLIDEEITRSGLPGDLLKKGIPIEIDERELNLLIKKQSSQIHGSAAENIKRNAFSLRRIPQEIKELSAYLVLYDFISGVANYIEKSTDFPSNDDVVLIDNSKNLFLENPCPISFGLDENNRCSILTGANSGGKTTLLEHVLQITSLFQMGLPVNGKVRMPIFSEIYYFAKNKGSMSRGAFETLLTQMSQITPGKQTLILADEIESVTEPGVAGIILCASAEYFVNKNCFMIIATHLGKEIKDRLPRLIRIDGIEAKGLDENYNLIVDHNPVLGRLANSTPELIVEKMANSYKEDYFVYLYEYLQKFKSK